MIIFSAIEVYYPIHTHYIFSFILITWVHMSGQCATVVKWSSPGGIKCKDETSWPTVNIPESYFLNFEVRWISIPLLSTTFTGNPFLKNQNSLPRFLKKSISMEQRTQHKRDSLLLLSVDYRIWMRVHLWVPLCIVVDGWLNKCFLDNAIKLI